VAAKLTTVTVFHIRESYTARRRWQTGCVNIRRIVRRVLSAVALLSLALAIASLVASVFFDWATGEVYPTGDTAMLELYTRHATHGVWALGPYSQFGWNHPGPLFFYLLAPLYLFSGEKTIALHAGAFAINLLSVSAIVFVLLRYAAPAISCVAAAAMGLYLYQLPIISSFWNPHIVILPAAAFLVLCTAVAARQAWALPVAVLIGSFLVQTHASLAPYVLVLASAALAAALWPMPTAPRDRSLLSWIAASTGLLLLLWLLPIAEQLSQSPGNITRMLQFFGSPSPGQELKTALAVWGDTINALFKRTVELPMGSPLAIPADAGTLPIVCAALQLLLLAVACMDAHRRQQRFDAVLAAAGILASLTVLWSLTQVKSLIGDYMVFWLSAIGVLNWAVIAGIAMTRLGGVKLHTLFEWTAVGASALVMWTFVHLGSTEMRRARRSGIVPPHDSARLVKLVSQIVLDDMSRHQVQRPLLHMTTQDWGAAAGVLLQVYKRGSQPAVDPSLVAFFGEPLAPTGEEDRIYVLADASSHPSFLGKPGYEFLTQVDGMYVHASSVVRPQPK
jgi:hypothetical protein